MAQSYWQATSSPPVFPSLHGELSTDVAVVGGGIAGLVTAYFLKKRGMKVAVLERGQIAGGETARTTAHLTALPDRSLHKLMRLHGKSRTERLWASSSLAIDLVESIVRDEGIACDFQRVDAVKFAPSNRRKYALEKERDTCRRLGVETTSGRGLPFDAAASFVVSGQARFDPLAFSYQLARRLRDDCCHIFSHTPVVSDAWGRLRTPGGEIKAKYFVYATHTPVDERFRIHMKLTPYQTYVVTIPRQPPLDERLYYDNLSPYHYLRNHGAVCIVGGADHKTGYRRPGVGYRALESYVRRTFGDVPVLQRWSGEVFVPIDGLPYIGKRSNHHFVITGTGGTGLTLGVLGASIVSDLASGRENPYADLYDPARVSGWRDLARHNLDTAYSFGRDWVTPEPISEAKSLRLGEGRVFRKNGWPVGVSKTFEGELRAVSAVCTHAGCVVRWNADEQSWDCPCHGSRFSNLGRVCSGPAKKPLSRVPLAPGRYSLESLTDAGPPAEEDRP